MKNNQQNLLFAQHYFQDSEDHMKTIRSINFFELFSTNTLELVELFPANVLVLVQLFPDSTWVQFHFKNQNHFV